MKLSEAIILGDSLRKRDSGVYLDTNSDGETCGCALGGALLAAGVTPFEWWAGGSSLPMFREHWPWLTQEHVSDISLFFDYVEGGQKTIEELADYVRSIEPQDFIQDLTQSIKQNADKFTECECCEALSEKAKGYWTEGHFYCELCSPAIREQEISIGNEQSDYQHGLGVKA